MPQARWSAIEKGATVGRYQTTFKIRNLPLSNLICLYLLCRNHSKNCLSFQSKVSAVSVLGFVVVVCCEALVLGMVPPLEEDDGGNGGGFAGPKYPGLWGTVGRCCGAGAVE